jgi:hypothetical protein
MGGSTSKPKPKPAISDIDRAILDLKVSRDRLQRYRQRLEQDEQRLLAQAKAAKAAGKQTRALGLLRLRNYKQNQLKSVEDQLLNVLQMVETIDSKQNESQLLAALSKGKDALKQLHQEHSVDRVLELMDQVQEEIEVEREINQILEDVPTLDPAQEEAVQAELEALMGETLPQVPTVPVELPQVPTTKLPQQQEPVKASLAEQRVAVPG